MSLFKTESLVDQILCSVLLSSVNISSYISLGWFNSCKIHISLLLQVMPLYETLISDCYSDYMSSFRIVVHIYR